jgi:murein DD-endopeptidase MepM/ murein hydrolase activator NlpD
MRYISLLALLLITACASPSLPGNPSALIAYLTATPSLTPAPNVIVILETPVPTSTPFVYAIQSGDTFSQLAERFKISQDELQAANPGVSPNAMPVGATLLIPDPSASAAASTLTPAPVPVTQIVCHPSIDSGVWCFALIRNITPDMLENVSAQINLLDESGNILASQTAFTPLDVVPPNSSLPVSIFFRDVVVHVNPQAQLLSALASSPNDGRYLPAKLTNVVTQINWDGYTAHISGGVALPAESKAATRARVAAVAYDKDGIVVGVKRWEGGAIQPGAGINFAFEISSLASAIDAVEVFVEAR